MRMAHSVLHLNDPKLASSIPPAIYFAVVQVSTTNSRLPYSLVIMAIPRRFSDWLGSCPVVHRKLEKKHSSMFHLYIDHFCWRHSICHLREPMFQSSGWKPTKLGYPQMGLFEHIRRPYSDCWSTDSLFSYGFDGHTWGHTAFSNRRYISMDWFQRESIGDFHFSWKNQ